MGFTLVVAHYGYRSASVIFEPDNLSLNHPANRRARKASTATGEPLPIPGCPERAFDPR